MLQKFAQSPKKRLDIRECTYQKLTRYKTRILWLIFFCAMVFSALLFCIFVEIFRRFHFYIYSALVSTHRPRPKKGLTNFLRIPLKFAQFAHIIFSIQCQQLSDKPWRWSDALIVDLISLARLAD